MTTRCIIALAACLLGTQAFAQTPVQQFNAKAAPAVKTFAQKTPEPIVAKTQDVEQNTSKKQTSQIKQDVETPLNIEYSVKVDGEVVNAGTSATLLRTAINFEASTTTLTPTCTFDGESKKMDVAGTKPVTGTSIELRPTLLTEEGVITMVTITIQKGEVQGAQELAPGCIVAEGKQIVETTNRAVTLTWDNAVTITTDSGTEVQITLKHDKNEKPVVATEST